MKVTIRGFNKQILSLFLKKKFYPILEQLKLTSSVIGNSTYKNKYTVNKSPHVFKKSKEQFELTQYKETLLVSTQNASLTELIHFEYILKKNVTNGIGISFSFNG